MKRAEIQGHVLSQKTHPCGRLVKCNYDSQRKVMSFDVPSLSRKDRVYGIELDCMSGQIACGCEAFSDYRNTSRCPYRDKEAGAFLEHVYARLFPLITRRPSGLCPHARKVRLWLKAHRTPDGKRLYDHIAAIVAAWEQDYLEQKTA